jgi:glucose/arabinose dehydrogenase
MKPPALSRTGAVLVVIVLLAGILAGSRWLEARRLPPGACDPELILPPGFCATRFADNVGVARHVAVASNGDVYVALWDGKKPGGILALRDTNADGVGDTTKKFGVAGGSGLLIDGEYLYHSTWTSVYRYRLSATTLGPVSGPDTILRGLPKSGHAARTIVMTRDRRLLVNIGAPTNACQPADRQREMRGTDPCTERDNFASVWSFDPDKLNQLQSDGRPLVKGLRHAVAMAEDPASGEVFVVQHGRDDLSENWPTLFTREDGQTKPAEEFLRLTPGADFGWPYCYYDGTLGRRVLAPEYGGDGKKVGRCEGLAEPLAALPAHWAPNGLLFYRGSSFPARYRSGAFIAFHGGWYRPPPDNGFVIGFIPMSDGRVTGPMEIFADGFAGKDKRPSSASHRPVGLAQDGAGGMFVTDDAGGRIWRITAR